MRIVILGAGPTGLSAAWRLQEHGHHDWMLLESSDRPGGLSMSVKDDAGFTWDLGGHVIFSHWKYFDRLLVQALGDQWVEHQREAWVWMRERWIPYPFQNNIWRLPPDELVKCLAGLVEAHRAPNGEPPRTFADWLQRSFGSGLCETFMYPYNLKVWAYPPSALGVGWMGERVAPVDLARILSNLVHRKDDVSWGPNATFRFPLRGGTGAISDAIAGAARAAGVEIRTQAAVSRILVRGNRAEGVVLENGDELRAHTVVSSLDPRQTFLSLVGDEALPDEFTSDIKRYKFRGSSGKVNLALGELPNFTCLPGVGPHLRGAISISPSIAYLERAYDDAKYGAFSREPYMDVIIPSMIDPHMAPPGKHVMSIFVQYAPYHLNGGWTDERREAFGDTVIETLTRYAPNLKGAILHRQVITPADIEQITGLTEGNIFQGELALHQLFFLRPAPRWAKYRTPIRRLYQCGSGTHPGGGISGLPGYYAAKKILQNWPRQTDRP